MPTRPRPQPTFLAEIATAPFAPPEAPALSGAGVALTYGELDRRLDAARGAYASLGLTEGDRVVLLLPSSYEFVIAYFAAHRAGLVVIPLNPLLGVDEVRYILALMRPALVVAAPGDAPFPVLKALDAILAEASPETQLTCYGSGLSFDEAMARAPFGLPAAPRRLDEEVLILFTSGTSGRPKGASHTQRAVITNATHANRTLGFSAEDRVLCPLPLAHVFGQMVMMLGALLAGAELILTPRSGANAVFDALTDRQPTFVAAVPTTFAALAEIARSDRLAAHRAGLHLRMAMAGGAPLPDATANLFEAMFGLPLHQGYGMTEVACCIALERPGGKRSGGVGRICSPLSHRIVPVSPETPHEGELQICGPNLFQGYYVEGGLETRAPTDWFATGDIVRLDARGRLFLCDRKKEMIIRNGYNVYPSEVEAALTAHPAVAGAAVIGVEDAVAGQEVAAFVSLHEGADASVEVLAGWCRERIALYKYPRLMAILPALPTNATGKILKRALDPALLSRVGAA